MSTAEQQSYDRIMERMQDWRITSSWKQRIPHDVFIAFMLDNFHNRFDKGAIWFPLWDKDPKTGVGIAAIQLMGKDKNEATHRMASEFDDVAENIFDYDIAGEYNAWFYFASENDARKFQKQYGGHFEWERWQDY